VKPLPAIGRGFFIAQPRSSKPKTLLSPNKKKCMFQFELDNAVVLHQQKVLEAALSTNPKTQKTLQKLID
jgi:hypothetical protein